MRTSTPFFAFRLLTLLCITFSQCYSSLSNTIITIDVVTILLSLYWLQLTLMIFQLSNLPLDFFLSSFIFGNIIIITWILITKLTFTITIWIDRFIMTSTSSIISNIHFSIYHYSTVWTISFSWIPIIACGWCQLWRISSEVSSR